MNNEIKIIAKEKGVRLWKIAEKLGINDSTFSRMLRYKLSEEEKGKITAIIDELAEGRG